MRRFCGFVAGCRSDTQHEVRTSHEKPEWLQKKYLKIRPHIVLRHLSLLADMRTPLDTCDRSTTVTYTSITRALNEAPVDLGLEAVLSVERTQQPTPLADVTVEMPCEKRRARSEHFKLQSIRICE